jgi:hypothetical protein
MVKAGELGRQSQIELSERRKLEYLASPNYCEECGKVLPYEKRNSNSYCGRSCSIKSSNRNRKKLKSCLACNAQISRRKTYCSVSCQKEYEYNKIIEEWLSGSTNPCTSSGCPASIKRYLREQSGNRCSKCGWGEVHPITGKVPLEINHIDGNFQNNSVQNLEILCPNCHSLTPTFRALNRGNGRGSRG